MSVGLSISFGLLDVPFIAHPAFLVMGAYATYVLAGHGMDPLLAGVLLMPVFFVFGLGVYQFYYSTFEGRGSDQRRSRQGGSCSCKEGEGEGEGGVMGSRPRDMGWSWQREGDRGPGEPREGIRADAA